MHESTNRLKKGRFNEDEEAFLKEHYLNMTDEQLANALNRSIKSVVNKRGSLGLRKDDIPVQYRGSGLANMTDDDRKTIFLRELRRTAQFRSVQPSLHNHEIEFYEERYVEFMMDPTIETMTGPERDALHRKTVAEIRLHRFLKDERDFQDDDNHALMNRAREIKEVEETIHRCEKALNVTREQRLKDKSDQAINFTTLIKDLQNPTIRREAGYEAAMFKWMAEKHYDDKLGSNIRSGRDDSFDLKRNFKSGVEPKGTHSEFTGDNRTPDDLDRH